MTKADILEKIHTETGYSKTDSQELLEAVISIIKQSLVDGEDIRISGFGNFVVKQKKDRRGRNPQTGESITIKARRRVSFQTSLILKNRINA